jgi:cytochrome c553
MTGRGLSSRIALFCLMLAGSAYAADEAPKVPKQATQVCAACHGADGNSGVPMYPKLAGQHQLYLTKQLAEFKSGSRKNAVMSPIAATLSQQDMATLSAYFNSQAPKSGKAKMNGAASPGEKIYRAGIPGLNVPACASCHGPAGAGIPAQFPRLAGQHAEYTVSQLKLFRSGERANDAAKMMRMIASRMSDQDMTAVADYIQGLR